MKKTKGQSREETLKKFASILWKITRVPLFIVVFITTFLAIWPFVESDRGDTLRYGPVCHVQPFDRASCSGPYLKAGLTEIHLYGDLTVVSVDYLKNPDNCKLSAETESMMASGSLSAVRGQPPFPCNRPPSPHILDLIFSRSSTPVFSAPLNGSAPATLKFNCEGDKSPAVDLKVLLKEYPEPITVYTSKSLVAQAIPFVIIFLSLVIALSAAFVVVKKRFAIIFALGLSLLYLVLQLFVPWRIYVISRTILWEVSLSYLLFDRKVALLSILIFFFTLLLKKRKNLLWLLWPVSISIFLVVTESLKWGIVT